jgi:hypothetical protein
VVFEHALELGGEAVRIEQVLDAQRAAGDLVLVGRADAAAGGADAGVAHRHLARLIERDVVGHDQRTRGRDRQARAHLDAGALEFRDLLQQRRRRDDHAVAEIDAHRRPQDA